MFSLPRQGLAALLAAAGVPQHVAFIMDGNRRFAEREHIERDDGHLQGYRKMIDVIHWCLELGVSYITVYAFSIDNFNRSPEEVGHLMLLAEEKFKELMQDGGLAERKGIEVRVLGDLSLPPQRVQGAAARIMQSTAQLRNKRAVLNICFAYTSTQELHQAVEDTRNKLQQQHLHPDDITLRLLHECLHTRDTPPVDLLLRTSGETRLSDFLLWQCSCAQLCFVRRYWPELTWLDFAKCILQYQRAAPHLQQLRGAVDQQQQIHGLQDLPVHDHAPSASDADKNTEAGLCCSCQHEASSATQGTVMANGRHHAATCQCANVAPQGKLCQGQASHVKLARSIAGRSNTRQQHIFVCWLAWFMDQALTYVLPNGWRMAATSNTPNEVQDNFPANRRQQAHIQGRKDRLDAWIASAASYIEETRT